MWSYQHEIKLKSKKSGNIHQIFRYMAPLYKHCNENPIYVFPEMKPGGLIPDFYMHVHCYKAWYDFQLPRPGAADSFRT
jgi:hypothetical protein